MKKVLITVLEGYPAFKEIMLSVQYSLEQLGFDVEISLQGLINPSYINIIFASHNVSLQRFKQFNIPLENIIIYNLEQVNTNVPWINARYFELMRHTHVWEYSSMNFEQLHQYGIKNLSLVPIGYTPNLENISIQTANLVQDIDVFFYGSMNERRIKAINEISAAGLNVVSTINQQFIDEERDSLIARSKIILNMHFYENAQIFEIARVSYLLANKKAVVSELGPTTHIDRDIKKAIVHGSIDKLPQLCLQLIHNDNKRYQIEMQGYEIFKQRNAQTYIQKGLENYFSKVNKTFNIGGLQVANQAENIHQKPTKLPKIMNLGCGLEWKYNMFNVDILEQYKPDLLCDISIPFISKIYDTWRFGKQTIPNNYFTHIYANEIFECVDNLPNALHNCLNWLQDGGILEIKAIHDLSLYAWSNPYFKRHFNEGSFLYYTYPKNLIGLGWQDYTFEVSDYAITLSQYGLKKYYEYNESLEDIKYLPRIIDYMTFKLKKRKISILEKETISIYQDITLS